MLERLAKSVVSCSLGSPTPHAPCDPQDVLGPVLGCWGSSVDSRRTSFKMRVMFSSVSRLMLTTARYDPGKLVASYGIHCHMLRAWTHVQSLHATAHIHIIMKVLSSPHSFPFPAFELETYCGRTFPNLCQ